MDHFSTKMTLRGARSKFSKEEVARVKDWTDNKVYDMTDDLSKVDLYSLSCKYITPTDYKGSCMLTTMTTSIGCKWATTMKQFVHLIALPTRE